MVIQIRTSLTILSLAICLTLALQPDLPSPPRQQFAELFTSDEGTNIYATNPDSNVITVNRLPESKVPTKLSGFFQLRRPEQPATMINQTQTQKGIPPIVPDAPVFVVEADHLDERSKREIPAWQLAWQRRYEEYQARHGRAQTSNQVVRTTKKLTTTTIMTTTTTTVPRKKFARQFVPNDQESRSVSSLPDPEDDNTVMGADQGPPATTPTTPVPDTTIQTTTTKRHVHKTKRIKTTRATTTSSTTEEPTTTSTTEEPTTTETDAIDAMVSNIITDLENKNMARPDLPPVLDVRPLWMEPEPRDLDPRKSQRLRDMIVQKHNFLRSEVSPPAGNMLQMEWNDDAQKIAQRWANVCKFEHDHGEDRVTNQFKCGQNLARGWPKPLSWNLTMQLWFDERKDFAFDGNPRGMVGHYTQLVWAQSYQIGCAYRDCGTFHYYVCDYCPTGNLDSKKYRPYAKASDSCVSCPDNCSDDGKLCTNPCPYTDKYSNCPALNKEFQVCTDSSYGLQSACLATCKCQDRIH